MKRILTAVTFSLILVVSTAWAQTNLAFLSSRSALAAYAVEQARSSALYLYGPGQIGAQQVSPQETWSTSRTSGEVLKFFTNTSIKITVANTKDWVSMFGYVANADGDTLFNGGVSAYQVDGKGGSHLPKFRFTLYLAYTVPIKFDQPVEHAEFWYLDPADGRTVQKVSLYGYGNKVYIQSGFAGRGYVVVTFKDCTQRVYNFQDGGAILSPTVVVAQAESAHIENLLSYRDPTVIQDAIQSYSGTGFNKTYEVVTSHPAWINISVSTTEGVYPIGYWVRAQGSQTWQYNKAASGPPYVPIQFGTGVWYVIPDWNPAQFQEPAPYIPSGESSGGGGGKG